MIYRTRRADHWEEPLTIVCKHDFDEVTTDNGPGHRCHKCSAFYSNDWYSPVTVLAVIDEALK